MLTMNILPFSGSLLTVMSSPCFLTMSYALLNPGPDPSPTGLYLMIFFKGTGSCRLLIKQDKIIKSE
jgi:hypothetical protein